MNGNPKNNILKISDTAYSHFCSLLKNEPNDSNLRIFVAHAGTSNAEIGLSYCQKGAEQTSDIKISYEHFSMFIDVKSLPYLEEAFIDYNNDNCVGEIAIKAPYLKGKEPAKSSSLYERIQYVINQEINPALASHGGQVSLISAEQGIVKLKFGGGCHGCGMAKVTLKHGIEKNLNEKFPEIVAIEDVTDHKTGTTPYYTR